MSRNSLQWLVAILFVLLVNPAHAAAEAFLCITDNGYPGETIVPGFANCSEIFDFGMTGFLDGSTPIARDIKFDKYYDSMSGPLRTAMVNLTTLNEVKIRVIKTGTGGTPPEFFDLRLLGAHVTSAAMSWNSGADGPASETMGFSAASMEVKYRPTNPQTGALGQAIYTCWNVAANTATNNPCQ